MHFCPKTRIKCDIRNFTNKNPNILSPHPQSIPERLSTRVALEGLDAGVGGGVLVEHGLLGEGLTADAALEGSLLAVHAGVHVQATGVRVRLTAHSTLNKNASWNKNNRRELR
jgi:hypothetical protein